MPACPDQVNECICRVKFVPQRWVRKGALAPCPPLFDPDARLNGGHAAGRVRVRRLCPPYELGDGARGSHNYLQSETAPVKGPLGLVPIAVTAFDDDRAFAAVPVPAAMQAAVMLTEL